MERAEFLIGHRFRARLAGPFGMPGPSSLIRSSRILGSFYIWRHTLSCPPPCRSSEGVVFPKILQTTRGTLETAAPVGSLDGMVAERSFTERLVQPRNPCF